ncbi:hypothetical protein POTOM_055672 [Populus tomentosa]|uniref:Uncharacterized protein n=1 Tax=Populus tomentosa TaxID=118781 RepID=A0A8X7XZM6_POPTO|nr:hypothetical protein POTOM_055672 [Populus tomentosa]
MAGRFLQIGVPVNGFDQFVKVTRDFSCNMTTVTGYCVDIFYAAVEALPYAMTYQYIPFAKPDGKSAGTYNDLVYQVYLRVFPKGSPLVADVLGSVLSEGNRGCLVRHAKQLSRLQHLGDPLLGDYNDDPNSNAQPPDQVEVQNIDQLIIPNQERLAAIEVNHENNI